MAIIRQCTSYVLLVFLNKLAFYIRSHQIRRRKKKEKLRVVCCGCECNNRTNINIYIIEKITETLERVIIYGGQRQNVTFTRQCCQIKTGRYRPPTNTQLILTFDNIYIFSSVGALYFISLVTITRPYCHINLG